VTTFWSSTKVTPTDYWSNYQQHYNEHRPRQADTSYHPTAINNRRQFTTYTHIDRNTPASSAD
jgi:hypothetical protein